MIFALLFVSRVLCSGLEIALISAQTPAETITGIKHAQDIIHLSSIEAIGTSGISDTDLVFDFLANLTLSLALRDQIDCSAKVINGNHYELDAESLFPSAQVRIGVVAQLLAHLSISEVLLIHSPESISFPIPGAFNNESILRVSTLSISSQISGESLKLLMRKAVKMQAVRGMLLWMDGEFALKVLIALKASQLDYQVTVLLVEEASWFDRIQTPDLPGNILILAERGCEMTASASAFLTCRIRQRVSNTLDFDFTVLQLYQGSAEIIGAVVHNHTSLCLECLKWEAVSSLSTRAVTIQFSLNNGTDNPSGPGDHGEGQFYWGAMLAVDDINRGTDVLPFGTLKVFNVSLGLSKFDPDWARQQLQGVTIEDLGLVFMHGHYSNVVIPLYSFLTSMNYTRPQIGTDNSSPILSSPIAFPHFARVTVSGAYTGVMFARFIKRYGWTRFGLMHCDDLYCTQLALSLEQAAEAAGLEIVTNASTHMVPIDIPTYPYDLIPTFQQFIDTKARILVLIMYGSTLNYCLEVLYDLGMRRGDLMFLPVMWLMPSLFVGTGESVRKRKELLSGAVQIYPGAFIGTMGKDIEERFIQRYGVKPPHFACTNYDGVLLLAHTLDYLRAIGADYEQTEVLSHELRKARFTGCSGDVSLQDGDRLPSVFDIQNAVVSDSGEVEIQVVGTYTPLSTVLFTFSSNITWPDGTSVVPGDTRFNPLDCPFEAKEMRDLMSALALELCCFAIFGLLAVLSTTLIWRKYWRKGAQTMQEPAEVSIEDYALFVTIGIEAVQYCYMGPAVPQWLVKADSYLRLVKWDLEKLLPTSSKLLLISVVSSLAAVCLWICLLTAAALRRRCGAIQLCYRLLPLLGNVCFLPIVTSLLSLFQCGQAASADPDPGLRDTYLLEDCYMSCWSEEHLKLTVPALLAFVIYVPSAVFLRPMWQETQETLHIPVSPAHLMVKSLYQLLTIVVNKALVHRSLLAYDIVFSALTAGYLSVSARCKPYGYGRANLWHFASLAFVLWYSVVVSLSSFLHTHELVWICLLSGGVIVLLTATQLLQVLFFPSKLYSKEGIPVVDLIRFQFSNRPQAFSRVFAMKGSEHIVLRTPNAPLRRSQSSFAHYRKRRSAYVIPGAGSFDAIHQRQPSVTNNT